VGKQLNSMAVLFKLCTKTRLYVLIDMLYDKKILDITTVLEPTKRVLGGCHEEGPKNHFIDFNILHICHHHVSVPTIVAEVEFHEGEGELDRVQIGRVRGKEDTTHPTGETLVNLGVW